MVSTSQLYNLVICNDYEQLSKIIQSGEKVDWKCSKSNSKKSLITVAIEHRSRECFDLLMTTHEISIDPTINGLKKAVEYNVQAQNPSNTHYLTTLLSKNIVVDVSVVIDTICNPIIFDILFERVDKTDINITNIIKHCISTQNFEVVNKMYDYLDTVQPYFYESDINKKRFNTFLLKTVIDSNKYQFVDFFVKKNANWQIVKTIGQPNIPTLYYIMTNVRYYYNNQIIFDYLYALYQSLDPDVLNIIPGIKTLPMVDWEYCNYKVCVIIYDFITKIIKLPIQINNLAEIIADMYKIRFKYMYHDNDQINNLHNSIMFIILQSGKVLSNPYIHINLNDPKCEEAYKNVFDEERKCDFKTIYPDHDKKRFIQFIQQGQYIWSHFGWCPLPEAAPLYSRYFTPTELANYETTKNTFIKQITEYIKSIESHHKNPKVTKKAKEICV
jgi:hypothetical protein